MPEQSANDVAGSAPAVRIEIADIRRAIHETRKVALSYVDDKGRRTERTVRPFAMAYYVAVTLVAAWCELRRDYRHFRVDRVLAATVLDESFPADNGRLMAEWLALRKDRAAEPA